MKTDPETYYTLGLFTTKEEAIKVAMSGDNPPTECEDYASLVVRIRGIGFTGWSNNGFQVASIEWKQELNETTDEFEWVGPVLTDNQR